MNTILGKETYLVCLYQLLSINCMSDAIEDYNLVRNHKAVANLRNSPTLVLVLFQNGFESK